MLNHIVLFKLKESAMGAGQKENALLLKRELEALKGKISEIRRMEVGLDLTGSALSYNLALYSQFDDIEALLSYQRHPEHVKVAELVSNIAQTRAVVDYIN